MEHINISGPSITQLELDYVLEATRDGWYDKANYYVSIFEKKFAEYIGTTYAVALPSCTSAIHLSLLSLGISEGDEVIIPDITWIASAAPISYVGATPVFADIDEKSWCLSAKSFQDRITEKTRAVIPVDLYGNMPEMDEINKIAKENNIAVIEDSAEAIGSEFKGRKAGSFGDTGVFSFHGSKTLTTGEGGMLVTNRKDIYERALFLRDHGKDPNAGKMFWNSEIAYKYKMSNLQAALGLAQLERIDELVAKKIQVFEWYKEELEGTKGISINYQGENIKNTYWMNTVVIEKEFKIEKEFLINKLEEMKISCRPFFYPLSSLPAYRYLNKENFYIEQNKVSYKISPNSINLPSSLNLSKEQVIKVCDALKKILGLV